MLEQQLHSLCTMVIVTERKKKSKHICIYIETVPESVVPHTNEILSPAYKSSLLKDRIRQGTEAPLIEICVLRQYLMASL